MDFHASEVLGENSSKHFLFDQYRFSFGWPFAGCQTLAYTAKAVVVAREFAASEIPPTATPV